MFKYLYWNRPLLLAVLELLNPVFRTLDHLFLAVKDILIYEK